MFPKSNSYERIPVLIYRYKDEYEEIYQNKLASCVELFNGKQKWVTFRSLQSRHNNYLLTLQIVFEKMKECKEENKLHIEKEEFSKSWEVMCNEAIIMYP